MRTRTAAVVRVELTRPLETIQPSGHEEVLLVVSVAGRVVGQVFVDAGAALEPEAQWRAIEAELGDEALGALVSRRVSEVAGVAPATDPQPAVSVIVCTRGRPGALDTCLASIRRLRTEPAELVVVDNTDGDEEVAAICARHGARCVVEPVPGHTRARNRGLLETSGELVAFTDDDCVVDTRWLDDLGRSFADRMVMCVTGYIGPLELETPAQYLFERHGGFERRPRRTLYDIRRRPPVLGAAIAGAGANMVFRREVFAEIGNFAEDLGVGTPARSSDDKYAFYCLLQAGYRIAYEPERIVWHRHRAQVAELRRTFNDYGVAEFAYTTRCLARHRDLSALHVQRWWLRHIAGEIARALWPGRRDVPLRLALEELRGALAGPFALRSSARSRRGIAALPPPAAPARLSGVEPRVAAEAPLLSVAVATHNRREGLRRLLEALRAQTVAPDRFEVVVVVDGAADASAEMARGFAAPYRLRVVEQAHAGLAAARNRGAREAAHPVVVFLDDDMEPRPEALAAHAAAHAHAREPHYALGYFPPAIASQGLWPLQLRLWWEDHFRRKEIAGHVWSFLDVVDGNSSIHVSRLLELGGFDERFSGGRRQDYELGIRMLRAGVPMAFHRDTAAVHHLDTSLDKAIRNAREEGRYDVLLARLHPEVTDRLPLAAVRQRLASSARVRPAARATSVRLATLEALRRRRRWRVVLDDALLRSYAFGAAEACGGPEALAELLRDAPPPQVTSVQLEPGAEATAFTASRAVELHVLLGDRTVAVADGPSPHRQWDWDAVLQRIERGATWPGGLADAARALAARDEAIRAR